MATAPLVQGTIEYLVVDITDLKAALHDLSGTTPKYDVRNDDGSYKLTAQNCVIDSQNPMRALCLIDTTSGGAWTTSADKTFRLYVYLVTGAEHPRIGPMPFVVSPA